MIQLKNICAGYDGEEVLHNVSMEFKPGKVTILVGPNGCGKSTLLKSIVRLNPHSSGQILINGEDIESYTSATLAQQVAFLPQSRNVPDIPALRMVLHGRFPYLKYPRRYREEDFEKAREALRWVGMEQHEETNVNHLSGGNQQKIYIAMALAQDTPVVLMDEPTTYLDISYQLRLMRQARMLADQGKAVVMVLHDLVMALKTADYIGVVSDGHLVTYGTPDEIYEKKVLDDVFGVRVCRVETEHGWQYYHEQ